MLKNIFLATALATAVFSEEIPQYLYKVLSLEDWKASQSQSEVQLAPSDQDFIHFSKEDQVERIVTKYWNGSSYVLLKVDSACLPGDLVFEANPGGSAKYYHLYNGSIPMQCVVESKIVKKGYR